MNSFLGLVVFLCGTSCSHVAVNDVNINTLQLVQILFRHGERVPDFPYPTDPYNADTFWKEGWGQLTQVGKYQEFQLGQYLRIRYETFVSNNFMPNEMYAVSSDSDRAIMSLELCLAGMFPTEYGTEWNSDLKWQPIPIRTIAKDDDSLLGCTKRCPKFETELSNSPELQQLNAENQQLFEYLSKYSGVHISCIDDIDAFYSTLMVEEMLGLPIPEWAQSVVHTEKFQYLYNRSVPIRTSTLELKRLRTGPLLKNLNSHFQAAISKSSKIKFYIYSGHDSTIVNLLNTLDIFHLIRPPYSSMVMMELHKNPETDKYFVNFLYRNETERDPYRMKLPGCEFDCPYEDFVKFIQPMIPENWVEECEQTSQPSDNTSTMNLIVNYFIACVVGLLLLGFAYFLMFKVISKCKTKTEGAGYEKL